MTDHSARFVVPREHPSFPGHFPGRPVAPGVLLLEMILTLVQTSLPGRTRLAAIPAAKFLRPIVPGEIIEARFTVERREQPDCWHATFQASCDEAQALEGTFTLVREDPLDANAEPNHG